MALWRQISEWQLYPLLIDSKLKCIHFLYPENFIFRSHKWKRHHRFILTVHQPPSYLPVMQRAGHRGFFEALRIAEGIVVLDEASQRDYRYFAPNSIIKHIPHGVDVNFFHPSKSSTRKPVVLTVGNWLRDYEAWLRVVQAAASKRSNLEFVVLADPTLYRALRHRIPHPCPKVSWVWGVDDVQLRRLYQDAAVLFLPLHDAVANNAILEAMACGLPIVATGLRAVIYYSGAALAAACNNSDPLGTLEQIENLLLDRERWLAASEAGRHRAATLFAWPFIAEQYRNFYKEILA
ncbi:MAG: glycosyltransferase family 4 protein [Verrucomicrobiae bacterium]|nr:glycosyltransferase family 4 protein [Verrucomicrobiae bacterium]